MVLEEVWQVIGLTARMKKVHVVLTRGDAILPQTRTFVVDTHDAPSLYALVHVTYEWSTGAEAVPAPSQRISPPVRMDAEGY